MNSDAIAGVYSNDKTLTKGKIMDAKRKVIERKIDASLVGPDQKCVLCWEPFGKNPSKSYEVWYESKLRVCADEESCKKRREKPILVEGLDEPLNGIYDHERFLGWIKRENTSD